MADMSGSTEGAMIVVKAASSSPAVIGMAVAIAGFLIDWPKTAKEGGVRIAGHAACVWIFGDLVMYWLASKTGAPLDTVRVPAQLLAGLPGWYLITALTAFIKYTQHSQKKSFGQLVSDIRKMIKK